MTKMKCAAAGEARQIGRVLVGEGESQIAQRQKVIHTSPANTDGHTTERKSDRKLTIANMREARYQANGSTSLRAPDPDRMR